MSNRRQFPPLSYDDLTFSNETLFKNKGFETGARYVRVPSFQGFMLFIVSLYLLVYALCILRDIDVMTCSMEKRRYEKYYPFREGYCILTDPEPKIITYHHH